MPPPPVTPSPHRFVIKKQASQPIRRTPLVQSQQAPPASTQEPQFNATPRFTFSSTPRPTPTQEPPRSTPFARYLASARTAEKEHEEPPRSTPFASRYLTPARNTEKEQDVIESFSEETPYESIERDGQEEIDQEREYADSDSDANLLDEPTPKRRRLSPTPLNQDPFPSEAHQEEEEDPNLLSSSLPTLSSPPPPQTLRHNPTLTSKPKFLLSTPIQPSTPLSENPAPFLKPPRFRPPDPTSQGQASGDPLPEHFSPHRKGQKYIPGGLAAEVRDWLINLESTPHTTLPTSHCHNKKRDEEFVVKVLVDEVKGGREAGMCLMRGRQVVSVEDGEMVDTTGEMRVILAGEGSGVGLAKGWVLEKGKRVGIKGPVWEVVIEGERWSVGVEWRVLPG